MFLSKLIPLFLIIEIDRLGALSTESLLIGNSKEIEMENMLIDFMTDLKNFSFGKSDPHRFIVLGKMENLLQTVKILLEIGVPYFISSETEAIVLPFHFGADSVVIFFINGYNDFEMNSTFAALPRNYKCRTLIISMKNNEDDQSINPIIHAAVKMKLKNVMVASTNGQMIKIYAYHFTASCEWEVVLTNTWMRKKGFKKKENLLDRHIPIINAHGCSKFLSTFELQPTMRLQKNENKTLHIIGGLEGRLVQTVAERLNVVLFVKVPDVVDKLWTTPDGTLEGIVGDVANEVTTFGIGQLRPTLERKKIVDFTTPYHHECIVWTVPLSNKWAHSILVAEFSTTIWILVILSVLLFSGLVYIIPKLKLGYRLSLKPFDVIAISLNYAIPRNPSGILCKLLFLLYLNYSRIISTAYSTSLSSILTATILEPTIVDEAGILAAGLRTTGSQSSLEMLGCQISADGTTSELINRYEVVTSVESTLKRMVEDRDIAYLRHRSTIIHIANKLAMAGKPVTFRSLPNCVISYYSVMVTQKGARMTGQINRMILQLREAGIFDYWLSLDRASKSEIKITEANNDSLFRLKSVFNLYLCCLVPAFLAFGAELIAFKLKLDWFTR